MYIYVNLPQNQNQNIKRNTKKPKTIFFLNVLKCFAL